MSIIPIEYKLGFHDEISPVSNLGMGISAKIVQQISQSKNEPGWMTKFRLDSLEIFRKKAVPSFGPDLSSIDYDNLNLYSSPTNKKAASWKDLPKEIRQAYEKIGVPKAERNFLAGVEAQYDSQAVYGSIKKKLDSLGVIFTDTDTALKKHPEIFAQYFGKLVSNADNKFAALNSAFWSGGSFIYVPKGIKVDLPLQAYFRINARSFGQFERTLIVADEGSCVSYVEGCSAPIYDTVSLHAAVVEIFVQKGASVTYTTIQNWSDDVINLVTKRARVEEDASMNWVDCNLGSKITMKYPSCLLMGQGAKGETLSLAIAHKKQRQDTGAKMFHVATNTSSNVISKSISLDGGKTIFRGMTHIGGESANSKSKTRCDALIFGKHSSSETHPDLQVERSDSFATHEATISRIESDQLFYLQSRGLTKTQAESLIVNGFAAPIIKHLPMEYALELNRLLDLEMENGNVLR